MQQNADDKHDDGASIRVNMHMLGNGHGTLLNIYAATLRLTRAAMCLQVQCTVLPMWVSVMITYRLTNHLQLHELLGQRRASIAGAVAPDSYRLSTEFWGTDCFMSLSMKTSLVSVCIYRHRRS